MNKNNMIFILMMVITISGCTVTKDKEFDPVDNSGYTLVRADIESLLFGNDERLWPEGSAIGVYGSDQGINEPFVIKNAGIGLKEADFYGPMVKGDIVAYYPYSETYIGEASALPFSLETDQVYHDDPVKMFLGYCHMAFANMVDQRLKFFYPAGLLKVTIESQTAVIVDMLDMTSEGAKLSGHGVFDGQGGIKMTESAAGSVELSCGEGVSTRTAEGSLTGFYIVMVPGTYTDLELSLYLKGVETPFRCKLPEITVEKVSSSDYNMVTVGFRPSGGPAGFDEVEVEFDE